MQYRLGVDGRLAGLSERAMRRVRVRAARGQRAGNRRQLLFPWLDLLTELERGRGNGAGLLGFSD